MLAFSFSLPETNSSLISRWQATKSYRGSKLNWVTLRLSLLNDCTQLCKLYFNEMHTTLDVLEIETGTSSQLHKGLGLLEKVALTITATICHVRWKEVNN